MVDFDFLVIGGGSGGLAAARRAANHGASVAVIEAGRLGGTCVNVGCVPKKIMYNAAGLRESLEDAAHYGFSLDFRGLDFLELKRGRDAYVSMLNGIYARNLERDGVTRIDGVAELTESGVTVGGENISATHVLIATGSRPKLLGVPGQELGITSDGFFELERLPATMAVVGAGYIGVELAGICHALGSRVTLVLRGQQPLRGFDEMLRKTLLEALLEAGVTVVTGAEVSSVRRAGGGLELVTASGAGYAEFDGLIWAIGRVPNTERLGLARRGVQLTQDGAIETDAFQNTNVPGLYAVGDVTGRRPLTPVAIAAGRRLADRLFGGQPEAKLDYENVPSVVFSHPPIGTVGLGEAEARARHGDSVRCYTSHFRNLYYALAPKRPVTAMKLVTVGPEERVVGIHVIGLAADEIIQGFAVALVMGATKADLDRTVAIHPTAAEELVTMR